MTNILTLMTSNIRKRPVTLRFPDRPKPSVRYRGAVQFDPAKCLTCGICEYVCVSAAITVDRNETDCEWSYDAGRCTFCGRCVRYCPGEALSQQEERPSAYEVSGGMEERHTVEYVACSSCGRPTMPFNETMLAQAFTAVTDEVRSRTRLCEKCRTRIAQDAVKQSFSSSDRRNTRDGR